MPRYFDKQPLRTGFRHLLGRAALIGLVSLVIGVAGVHAQSPVVSENQLKAVYLFNLTGFVSWPQGAFASPEAPLRIAVAGDNRAAVSRPFARSRGSSRGRRPD